MNRFIIGRSLLLWLLLFCFMTAAHAEITAEVGFLQPRFNTVPVGEIVDLDALQVGGRLTLDGIEEFFYVRIHAAPRDRSKRIYIHITGDLGGVRVINFVSYFFDVRDWFSVNSNGRYTNREIAQLEETDWFFVNFHQTFYAEIEDMLELIEGGNLVASRFTIGFRVFEMRTNALLATFNRTVQIYNPSPPDLQEPLDGEREVSLPAQFSWEWSGGPTAPTDWQLIIVEGMEGEDGETVIDSRSPTNTRYDGQPSTPTSHLYTGVSGDEQALLPGRWYYWQVRADVPTVVPGGSSQHESGVFSFRMSGGEGYGEEAAIELEEPADGDIIESVPIRFSWQWIGDETVLSDWLFFLVEGDRNDEGEEVIEGRIPANTVYEGTPQTTQSHLYSEQDGAPLRTGAWYFWQIHYTDSDTRQEYVSGIRNFQFTREEIVGDGARLPEDRVPGDDQALRNLLASILTPAQFEKVMKLLEGYSSGTIKIDGQPGFSVPDLSTRVNSEGFEVITVSVTNE